MVDEYTFSFKEILRQKIGRMIHKNTQTIVGFQGKFADFKTANEILKGGGMKMIVFLKK